MSYNVPDTDLAYTAGLIDGEGTISASFRRQSGSKSPLSYVTVRVGMVDFEVISWLHETFGGSVFSLEPREGRARRLPFHVWSLFCGPAADFLQAVLPYLKLKRYRAQVAIALARQVSNNRKRYSGKPLGSQEISLRFDMVTAIRNENRRVKLDSVRLTGKEMVQ